NSCRAESAKPNDTTRRGNLGLAYPYLAFAVAPAAGMDGIARVLLGNGPGYFFFSSQVVPQKVPPSVFRPILGPRRSLALYLARVPVSKMILWDGSTWNLPGVSAALYVFVPVM